MEKKVFYSESMDPPCESKSGLRSYFQSLIKSKQLDYILLLTKKTTTNNWKEQKKKKYSKHLLWIEVLRNIQVNLLRPSLRDKGVIKIFLITH